MSVIPQGGIENSVDYHRGYLNSLLEKVRDGKLGPQDAIEMYFDLCQRHLPQSGAVVSQEEESLDQELLLEIRDVVVDNVLDGDDTGAVMLPAGELADQIASSILWWLSESERRSPLLAHYSHRYLRKLLSAGDDESIKLIAPQVIYQLLEEIDDLKNAKDSS